MFSFICIVSLKDRQEVGKITSRGELGELEAKAGRTFCSLYHVDVFSIQN